jgi:hypothetical protein
VVQRAALAIAKHARDLEDPPLTRREELLAGEFGRGAQIKQGARSVGPAKLGREGMKMRLVAGRDLQRRGLDLDEIARLEPAAERREHARARQEKGPSVGVPGGVPPA